MRARSKPHTPAVSATANPDNTARCNDEHDFIRTPKLGRLEPPVLGQTHGRGQTPRPGSDPEGMDKIDGALGIPQRRRSEKRHTAQFRWPATSTRHHPEASVQRLPSTCSPRRVGRLARRPAARPAHLAARRHHRGKRLEPRLAELQSELDARGILSAAFWLSAEWFSPDGVPGVAIPFYLAHPRLAQLERAQMLEVEGAPPSGA